MFHIIFFLCAEKKNIGNQTQCDQPLCNSRKRRASSDLNHHPSHENSDTITHKQSSYQFHTSRKTRSATQGWGRNPRPHFTEGGAVVGRHSAPGGGRAQRPTEGLRIGSFGSRPPTGQQRRPRPRTCALLIPSARAPGQSLEGAMSSKCRTWVAFRSCCCRCGFVSVIVCIRSFCGMRVYFRYVCIFFW